jgi:hypothetical protein
VVFTTLLLITIDAALALGLKYYNKRGELLTTRRAVLETLRQEGAVISKGSGDPKT